MYHTSKLSELVQLHSSVADPETEDQADPFQSLGSQPLSP